MVRLFPDDLNRRSSYAGTFTREGGKACFERIGQDLRTSIPIS
jgi:hypothetical protein